MTKQEVRAKALPISQGDRNFFSAIVSGKMLLSSCFVSRREGAQDGGFNRALSQARARDIARYLERGSSIPTNIILSAQPEAQLSFDNGYLRWWETPESFLVLDGQHRLYSMEYTKQDYEFVVAIYNDLSPQDEVQLFVDINTNQKGVPPALLLDIKHLAGNETNLEAQLRRLFDEVAADLDSPLRGQMSPAATKSGQISRVSFNTALKKSLEAGPLANMSSYEDQSKLVVNYLIAADRVITASGAVNNRLTKSTVLQAFFEVFDDVVNSTLERAHSLKPDALTETMAPLSGVNYDLYIGSNRPSKGRLVADMRSALSPRSSVTPDML